MRSGETLSFASNRRSGALDYAIACTACGLGWAALGVTLTAQLAPSAGLGFSDWNRP